ncbi:MAG: hypothetical protein AVDCRST_MAG96-3611, partial [uncultured Segetibacter sp.]
AYTMFPSFNFPLLRDVANAEQLFQITGCLIILTNIENLNYYMKLPTSL